MNNIRIMLALDPNWGSRINEFLDSWHCWVWDSEINRSAMKSFMASIQASGENSSFNYLSCKTNSPVENIEKALTLIFDHHNEIESGLPLGLIVLYGIHLSDDVKSIIASFDLQVKDVCDDHFSLVPLVD